MMDDLISKQAAIDAVLSVIPYDEYWKEQIEEAVGNLPSAQPEIKTDGDTISRAEAIEIVNFECGEWEGLAKTIVNGIKKLPTAQPETNCSEFPNNSDLISRQDAIDALDEQIELCNKALGSFDISTKDEYAIKVERASLKAYREQLKNLPSAQPERKTGRWISEQDMADKLTRLINEFEMIMSDIREKEVDDSVCGLCEYDADHGMDGYANECPGYEKDDCFRLKDEYRKQWMSMKC